MDKKQLSERDICTKFITPAVEAAGWDKMEQIREEVSFTAGPIRVRGNMAVRDKKKIKRADYILSYKPNRPIALIEAKDNKHTIGDGMQQGLDYANTLDIPFVFSSNGDGFLFYDRTGLMGQVEKELSLDEFPNPEELWTVYREWKGWTPETTAVATCDYYTDLSDKEPRYYQEVAIIRKQESTYGVTNLGGVLFAKDLNFFPTLKRKAVRVIFYEDDSRINAKKEQAVVKGYAVGFEGLVGYLYDQLPANELIEGALRFEKKMFP